MLPPGGDLRGHHRPKYLAKDRVPVWRYTLQLRRSIIVKSHSPVTKDEISDRHIEASRRFFELLPRGKELDLVILKAHLLIEEQLNFLLAERLKNPSVLDEIELGSFHRICLAQSFFPPDHQPWLWKGLKKLNKLRNHIAHNLEPKGVQDRIDDLISGYPPGALSNRFPERQARFKYMLWLMHNAISELLYTPRAPVVVFSAKDD